MLSWLQSQRDFHIAHSPPDACKKPNHVNGVCFLMAFHGPSVLPEAFDSKAFCLRALVDFEGNVVSMFEATELPCTFERLVFIQLKVTAGLKPVTYSCP